MNKLTHDDLYTLEAYEKHRPEFRARVMEHKTHRRITLGENIRLIFEDRLTMHYQIQEMLRAEKIFTEDGITEELDAYNPLIPDGTNWKVTMMIEYPDPEERRAALEQLVGIEDRVWVSIAQGERIYAIADEDLERSTESKTSSVHFLRIELPAASIEALKRGAELDVGVDHPRYDCHSRIPPGMCESLIADLA